MKIVKMNSIKINKIAVSSSIWLYFLSPVFLLFCLSGCVADPENLNILRKAKPSSSLSVSGGLNHNLVINKSGELWSWGRGLFGRIGDGSTNANRNSPRKISGSINWKAISGGGAHSLAITETGELYVWGNNVVGQLGDGTTEHKSTLTRIGTDKNWKKVAAGNVHSLAITETGELYAWGSNTEGELGDGTKVNKNRPTKINHPTDPADATAPHPTEPPTKWKAISAGTNYSLAITESGELYTWGGADNGRLGHGSTSGEELRPKKINHPTDPADATAPHPTEPPTKWKAISAGTGHVLAITEAGELYTWGQNGNGQLGDGSNTLKARPTKINHPTDPADATAPHPTEPPTKWKVVSAGNAHSLAITESGELYAWGWNNKGQLGNGTTDSKNRPTRIGDSTNWEEVFAGAFHSLATKKNSEPLVYSWGANNYGQLGDGTTTPLRTTLAKTRALIFLGI